MDKEQRKRQFLYRAKEIHGSKFDYSSVEYVNSSTKVQICCTRCGRSFNQTPMSHVNRSAPCGCPHCRYEIRKQSKPYTTLTTETFIKKAKETHKRLYDYSNVDYVNSATKIVITCVDHGNFEQTPNNHLTGQGCPACALEEKINRVTKTRLTTTQFIKRASQVHNNLFSYNNTKYVSSIKPIIVTCIHHGDFQIKRAEKHLYGQGCPSCTHASQPEILIASILEGLDVVYIKQQKFEECRSPFTSRHLAFDFFLPDLNTLIEYDGEQHFKYSPLFHRTYERFKQYQTCDRVKDRYASEKQLRLVRLNHQHLTAMKKVIRNIIAESK